MKYGNRIRTRRSHFKLMLAILFLTSCKVSRDSPGKTAIEAKGTRNNDAVVADSVARIPRGGNSSKLSPVAAGERGCKTGGVLLSRFQDVDGNGVYDAKVDTGLKEDTVCHTPTARQSTRQTSLSVGDARCPAGGIELETYVDTDGDGAYTQGKDSDQVATLICNGQQGATGVAGDKGTSGTAGVSHAALSLPAGSAQCSAGGYLLVQYVDLNNSRAYDAATDSTLSSESVCLNPSTGFDTQDIAVGNASCPEGGTAVRTWRDLNADGTFNQPAETLLQLRNICNGVKGDKGFNAVVQTDVIPPSSPACASGGFHVRMFTDTNADNQYDAGDLNLSEQDLCHGSHAMWVTQTIPVGDSRCRDGGVHFRPFVDLDNSRTLGAGDIRLAEYNLCNGRNIAGYNALVVQERLAAGDTDCPNGGYAFKTSTDSNKNGQPDPADLHFGVRKVCADSTAQIPTPVGTATQTVTIDPLGYITVVDNIAQGNATCPLGGKSVRSGEDSNGDGVLQDSEGQFREDVQCDAASGSEPLRVQRVGAGSPSQNQQQQQQGSGSGNTGCSTLSFPSAPLTGTSQSPALPLDASVQVCEEATSQVDPMSASPLSGRFLQSAVKAEFSVGGVPSQRFLVWGGRDLSSSPAKNDGAAFDPATGTWTPLSKANAPSGRWGHTSVWTGTTMIVFGGTDASGNSQWNGKRYDPVLDKWTDMRAPPNGTESRFNSSMTWTGTEFIVWGGSRLADGGSERNDGVAYDPVTDTWRKLVVPPAVVATPFPTVGSDPVTPTPTPTPPPLPATRHFASLGYCDDQLLLTGGRTTSKNSAEIITNHNYQRSTFSYTNAVDVWTLKTDLPVGLAAAGSACLNGRWHVQGGIVSDPGDPAEWSGLPYPWIHTYTPSAGSWSNRVLEPLNLIGTGATFPDEATGRLVMTLGASRFGATTHFASYGPAGWKVSAEFAPGEKRLGASTVWDGNRLWTWGGLDANNTAVASGFSVALP